MLARFQRRHDDYANVNSRILLLLIRSKRRKKPLAYLTGIAHGSADTAYDVLDRLDVEVGRRAGRFGTTPAMPCTFEQILAELSATRHMQGLDS